MKIAVIGSPGSGKSTLSLRLQEITQLPLYHLDQYYWKPGWRKPDKQEFRKIHDQLCDKKEWITDGMAKSYLEYRLDRADVIIFLDTPRWLCFYRIFERAFLNFGKVYKASAQGCSEGIPSWEFLKYTWNFHRKKQDIQQMLDMHTKNKKIFVVKHAQELDALLKSFQNAR